MATHKNHKGKGKHTMPGGMMMSDSEMKGMMNGPKMPMKGKKGAAPKKRK